MRRSAVLLLVLGLALANGSWSRGAALPAASGPSHIGTVAQGLAVGQPHQGGIIAHIFEPGEPGYIAGAVHGLIVAPADQAETAPWYNGTYLVTGATGTALGTGRANTELIVAKQGPGRYAAKLCADLVLGGYDDWFLPSKDELDRIYDNKRAIGGFAEQRYWTSSEASRDNAWPQNFANGYQYHLYDKFYEIRVRAVRTF